MRTKTSLILLAIATMQASTKVSSEYEIKLAEQIKYNKIIHNNTKYHVITIPQHEIKNYDVSILFSDEHKNLEELVDEKTIVAINGSFFTNNRIIGLTRTNNRNITPHERIRGSGYLTINEEEVKIQKDMPDTTDYTSILQSFPLIKYEGEIKKINNGKRRHRTAIALDEDNLYFIKTHKNMFFGNRINMHKFAEFAESQNYKTMLNLDGGGSSQIYFNNNKIGGRRKIPNAIAISRRNK